MMIERSVTDSGKRRKVFKHLTTLGGMFFDLLSLLFRKCTLFIQDLIRNGDFSAVMHESEITNHLNLIITHSHTSCNFLGIERNSRGMSFCIFILCINEIRKGLHRLFDDFLVMFFLAS